MIVTRITEELFYQLEERDYKGCIASIQHLRDLQEEIEGRHREGLFDEEFYQEWLAGFTFSPPDSLPGARSLIVVAVPQPQFRVIFTWKGKRVPLIVPPTYLYSRETDKQVEDLLAEILAPAGYHVARATVPKKLLAVRSGLGEYGKNNISYVPGMGSLHRLVAFYSDLPCQEDNWRESQMMEGCQNCYAWLRNCPTDAITSERFLLRAERCITFHSERPGDVAFPAWIDPSWHNCLVGCLRCQGICPENRDFLQWVEEKEGLSQEEITLLLEGTPLDQLPAVTLTKLEQLDFARDEDVSILSRNLGVFFER